MASRQSVAAAQPRCSRADNWFDATHRFTTPSRPRTPPSVFHARNHVREGARGLRRRYPGNHIISLSDIRRCASRSLLRQRDRDQQILGSSSPSGSASKRRRSHVQDHGAGRSATQVPMMRRRPRAWACRAAARGRRLRAHADHRPCLRWPRGGGRCREAHWPRALGRTGKGRSSSTMPTWPLAAISCRALDRPPRLVFHGAHGLAARSQGRATKPFSWCDVRGQRPFEFHLCRAAMTRSRDRQGCR